MVNEVVNNQESVMRHLENPNRDMGILGIVFGNVQFKQVSCFLRINGGINARRPLVQHGEDGVIHVVVYENDSGCCGFDEFTNELVCVVHLTLEEDTLLGLQ